MKPDRQAAGVLAVFESAERAEEAVNHLQRAGFDLRRLSIIGRQERETGLCSRLGALLSRVAIVSAVFAGQVVALGPLAGRSEPSSYGGQASPLTVMLTRAGISPGAARTYEAAVRGGQIVVLVHGGAKELLKARRVLSGGAALR